jgi:3-phytase
MIRLLLLVLAGSVAIAPARSTTPLPHDPDDPAIWRHPTDPARSLVLATDKIESKGGLYVFGLDGKLRQTIAPLDRPNNVDIEYGVRLGGRTTDVAVLTERKQHRLRIFQIPADGGALTDLATAGLPVLAGQSGDRSEPMGIALYKRPKDGAVFAIVAPKGGDTTNYLWQYRLESDGARGVRATFVRRFGDFSRQGVLLGSGEIEAVVADDELGYVYYSDERFGVRKWHADPDHKDAGRELAVIGREGYRGDREGLAIYAEPAGRGYLVSTDQIAGGSRLNLFTRNGGPGGPHDHQLVAVVETPSDETDGIDVTSAALPGFPRGLLVMMNSGPKNFLFYRWEDIVAGVAR